MAAVGRETKEHKPSTYVLRCDLLPGGSCCYLSLEDAKRDLAELGERLRKPGTYGCAKLSCLGQLIGSVSSPNYEWDYSGAPSPVAPVQRVMPWEAKRTEIRLR